MTPRGFATSSAVAVLVVGFLGGVHPAGAADVAITQRDKSFSEKSLTVKSGDRVVFTNADGIVHNVYSATPGHEFELKTQKPGQSDTVPFTKPGTVEVQCAIHPKMKLQVTVAP